MRLSFGPFAEHFVTIYFALLALLAAFDAMLIFGCIILRLPIHPHSIL